MRKFRCAIIGCGRIGCGFDDKKHMPMKRTHATGYYLNPKTHLVALCDIDDSKLKKYSKKYSVSNLYTNSEQMFEKEDLDFVSICTLVDSHLKLVKQAVKERIKGIFIEKPVSDSLTNIKKIINLCNKNNIILVVDHPRRFEPFYQDIKKIIKQRLGNIQHVNVYYGSGIANTGSHVFDLLRLLFGEVGSVFAKKSKFKPQYSMDPDLDIILEFKIGLQIVLQALDQSKYGVCELDIFGTKGRLYVDLLANNIKLLKPKSKTYDYKKLIQEKIVVRNSQVSGTILGIQNLVNCVTYNKLPLCSGFDGYKSLELVIASILSSSKNKKIYLPLSNNSYKIRSK